MIYGLRRAVVAVSLTAAAGFGALVESSAASTIAPESVPAVVQPASGAEYINFAGQADEFATVKGTVEPGGMVCPAEYTVTATARPVSTTGGNVHSGTYRQSVFYFSGPTGTDHVLLCVYLYAQSFARQNVQLASTQVSVPVAVPPPAPPPAAPAPLPEPLELVPDPSPLTVNATNARDSALEELVRAYGPNVQPGLYLSCPLILQDDDSRAFAECYYQFTRAGKTRVGSITVRGVGGSKLLAKRRMPRIYSQRTQDCGRLPDQVFGKVKVTGRKIVAQRGECGARLIREVSEVAAAGFPAVKRRISTFIHGTGTGLWPGLFSYPCRVRSSRAGRSIRYRVMCANDLGDHFAYSFTVSRRVVPPPKRVKPQISEDELYFRRFRKNCRAIGGTPVAIDTSSGRGYACRAPGGGLLSVPT